MTTNNVQLLKFSSGEEIIADITEIKNDSEVTGYKVSNAIRVVIMPPENSNDPKALPRIVFAAFIPYLKTNEFTLLMKDVLFVAQPVDEIVEQWKAIFGKSTSIWLPGGDKGPGGVPNPVGSLIMGGGSSTKH